MLPGEIELAAVHGDDRDREVVRRHLDAVLDRDVVSAGGVLGRDVPVPGPELDPGQTPRCACGSRLVSLARLLVLPLEERTRFASLPGRRKRVRDRLGRLADELVAADCVRGVAWPRAEILVAIGS